MAKAGININDVACHFGSHKTTAKRTINRFWQTGLAGDCPEKSLNPLEERFSYITSGRERFLSVNSLC